MSPVMHGRKGAEREKCLQRLSPFWAVLGVAGAKRRSNMEIELMIFREQAFLPSSNDFPKVPAGASFQVSVPILRNVTPIEKDEVLCIPPFD